MLSRFIIGLINNFIVFLTKGIFCHLPLYRIRLLYSIGITWYSIRNTLIALMEQRVPEWIPLSWWQDQYVMKVAFRERNAIGCKHPPQSHYRTYPWAVSISVTREAERLPPL